MADASKAITGTELLKTLELRLDNVVYTLGFANSRREARQLIGHNHFLTIALAIFTRLPFTKK